ncbi:MAG: hypothetical protein K5755_07460 [Clostridiales bacterium]|nr:hypothetical protein [Clostridia bacterium]MCR4564452.1 hypothetical protein [Clostridiales bacterium]
MARRLNAELWDKMHYLFRDYNDRMVHVELHYDFRIDIDVLKTVITCFFEKAPVLHSSFTDNKIHPYWTVEDYHINDILTVKEVEEAELDKEINDFLVQYIPTDSRIQMKIAVFFCGEKSVLCVVENHMCMDGGDLKYFMKSLCKNYTDYAENKISPVELRTGTRSYEAVYEDFTAAERKMAKGLYKNINTRDNHAFPLTPDNIEDKSFIARRKLSAETFDKIRAVGKTRGATVNEMLLTAYFYSVYELNVFSPDEGFSISCAIDLRRHITDNSDQGVTNQTAWMQCKVPKKGKDIFETLDYVIHTSNQFKQDRFMGLHGLPLLSLGYKIMPHAASEEIIKVGYANPLMAMSNIGILEADKLALCSHEPTDGFMSGAVKYKPYVLLSATSMRKEITLSMCVRGNDRDKEIVEHFFDLMEKSIGLLIGEE